MLRPIKDNIAWRVCVCSSAGVPASGRQVRLVGGAGPWQGVVQVYIDSGWHSVVANRWTEDEASVVCRQLGYVRSEAHTARIKCKENVSLFSQEYSQHAICMHTLRSTVLRCA